MKRQQTKDAAHAAKKRAMWRTVTKDGKRALRSPDGVYYYGTPREIRECALMPHRRDELADSLRMARRVNHTRDELRESCAERRRGAAMWSHFDRVNTTAVYVPPVLHVLLGAIARYRGETVEETLADVLKSDLLAAIDCAQGEGLPTLPLTRHERDALRALDFDAGALAGDYESALAEIAKCAG